MAGTVVSSRTERLHTDLISRVSRRTNVVKRDFDLIVYGATGYTGRLVADYLATSYRGDDAPSWAIADARPTSSRRCGPTSAHQTICLWLRRMPPSRPASVRCASVRP